MGTRLGKLSSWTSQTWFVPTGLLVLALGLRLYCLDCQGLTYDEVASIEVAKRGLNAIFNERFGWMQLQTPLHYLIVWLTMQVVDPIESTVLLRLPSAVAGALTIPIVYALGRDMFGKFQGVVAGLLMLLSAEHLNTSQNARPYAILVLLATLSVYSLLVAVRSSSVRWWTLHATATASAVFLSYIVPTIFLPTLAPFLLWTLWKLWRIRDRQLPYALASLSIVAIASALMLADLIQIPRVTPDLSRLNDAGIVGAIRDTAIAPQLELVLFFIGLGGLGGQVEQGMHTLLAVLAVLGGYLALRQRRWEQASICLLFVSVPAAILAVLATTNVVYQRYALFVMPFYFLLVANGAVFVSLLAGAVTSPLATRKLQWGTALVGLVILSPFIISVYGYFRSDPARSQSVAPQCDYRGVAKYLTEQARPEDIIVFGLIDPTIANLYWRGTPPGTTYNIVDPLLFLQPANGSIFWVLSYGFGVPERVLHEARWVEIKKFGCVTLLREKGPNADALETMELLISGIETELIKTTATHQVANTLRGSIYQAQDQIERAAQSYRHAGTFLPLAPELLRTSQGYAKYSEWDAAWRDAVAAKAMQPHQAEVHSWMAELLKDRGFEVESRRESQIAEALQSAQANR